MSEVRMSLQEYNEMKDKLDRQERILSAFLTPTPFSDWDMKYFKEHHSYHPDLTCDPMSHLSTDDQMYLNDILHKIAITFAEEHFTKNGIAVFYDLDKITVSAGSFHYAEDTKKEESENEG